MLKNVIIIIVKICLYEELPISPSFTRVQFGFKIICIYMLRQILFGIVPTY